MENPRELDVLSGYASLHYHVYGDLNKAEQLFQVNYTPNPELNHVYGDLNQPRAGLQDKLNLLLNPEPN